MILGASSLDGLTLDDFKAWLLEKHPDHVVGQSDNCTRCPLVNYIQDRLGVGVRVYANFLIAVGTRADLDLLFWWERERVPLPEWMLRVTMEADRYIPNTKITADDMLQMIA